MNPSNRSRRTFLKAAAGAGLLTAAAPIPRRRAHGSTLPPEEPWEEPVCDLHGELESPVKIASIELLRMGDVFLLRVTSSEGATGIAATNDRIRYLRPILEDLVAPYFVGKDARDLEGLVDGVYVAGSHYKLAGLAFWNPVGWVELAVFDLLGKVARKPVAELLGGAVRKEVPIYLSSMRRDTTPEEEVAWVGKRLEETGAKAVKLKIGGRMSRNADAAPGRTDRLIPLARKVFGDSIAIHVDANGSYDAPKAIEVGKLLQEHDVFFFEEPCPFEEFEETKRVADALEIPVAGGEQDTSLPKFRWMIQNRGVDIVQPDVNYNGGLVRTRRVARLAAEVGMDVTPHAPQGGLATTYLLQFAAATPNLGR